MEIIFDEFRDVFLLFVGRLGIGFSNFLSLENKLENETIFCEKPDLKTSIWLGRSVGIWAL